MPYDLDLTAIIISYNTRDMTLKCLKDLHASLQGIPSEVIVVDNASGDGSPEAIRSAYPDVILVENQENRGFGAANNQAMRIARGEFFLLLNSDAFVQPDTVAKLLGFIRQKPQAAVVGPRLLNEDGSLQVSCYRFPTPGRVFAENFLLVAAFPDIGLWKDYRNWAHDQTINVDFLIGACMLLRRTAVEEIELFDEAFFLYSEETDLCYRLHLSGWSSWFTPDATVTHKAGGSGLLSPYPTFSEFRFAQELFFRKHFGSTGLAWHRFCYLSGSLIRIALFGLSYLLRRDSRKHELIAEWFRILIWTLGHRPVRLAPEVRR